MTDDPNSPMPESNLTPEGVGGESAPFPPGSPSQASAAEPAPAADQPGEAEPTGATQAAQGWTLPPAQAMAGPADDEMLELAPSGPSEVALEEPPEVEAPKGAEPEAPAAEPAGPAVDKGPPPKAQPPKDPAPETAATEAPAGEGPKSDKMDWYILKVQSNREESIREGLRKRIKIAGLDYYFGDIIIPTEKVTEFKAGKRRVFKRKLYPGYLVVQMEINEDTWFLVRETTGIGDFTGAGGHPTPMQPREVASILAKQEEKTDAAPKLKINFAVGDHVKIKEGTFENFEGEVATIDETNGRVTVLINIFGRSTPVDIEYWQIEAV